MFDTNNKHHTIDIQVLAAEDTWETPSLILATAPSGGKVIFSQVIIDIYSKNPYSLYKIINIVTTSGAFRNRCPTKWRIPFNY